MLISTVEEQISLENGGETVKEFPLGSKSYSFERPRFNLDSTNESLNVQAELTIDLDPSSFEAGDSMRKEYLLGSKENSIDGAESVKKELFLGSNAVEKEGPVMLMEKEKNIAASNSNSTNGGVLVGKETPIGPYTRNSSDEEELTKKSPNGSNPNSELETISFAEVLNLARERENEQLEQTISSLEEEIACLKLRHRSFDDKRRESLNKILDLKGTIRVFCRIRPFCPTDKRTTHQPITVESEKIIVRSAGSKKEFGFDKVFPEEATQEHVYIEVEPILRSALDGRNVCILAYGQSGTGKTFTMDGTNESPGILPRALEEIFRLASLDKNASISFSISMLEVYLGSLKDLLAQKPSRRVYAVSKCNLNIQTDTKGSVEIDGLTEVEVSNLTKARWWYNKGRRARATSWTNVNEASSRSHCLTRITIYQPSDQFGGKSEVGKIWLVDLGGSERLLKTGATGQTLDEGRAINLSLSALADVIAALRRKKGHVPYRNSKLTQILRDSLGDGSKVVMLVHVSPCEEDVGETTYSSTFARRARAVESVKEMPEDARKQKEKKIAEFECEMKEAEEESLKVKNQIKKLETTLKENKRLLTMNNQLLAEEEGESAALSPIDNNNNKNNNPKDAHEQTPLITEKPVRRNSNNRLPRFMYPTVASLERQSASEREIDGRSRILRSGTRQSFSYPDSRFKSMLKYPTKKTRYADSTNPDISPVTDSGLNSSSGSKTTATMPRGKIVATSDPNLRVPIIRHTRRMSDLI